MARRRIKGPIEVVALEDGTVVTLLGGVTLSGGSVVQLVDGNGTPLDTSREGALETGIPEVLIEACEDASAWTGSADVSGIADEADHRGPGTQSVAFDKSGVGAATGRIHTTLTATVDLRDHLRHSILDYFVYLSSLTDVSAIRLYLGADASNYWYWETPASELQAGWSYVTHALADVDGTAGDGAWLSAVRWVAVEVVMDAAGDTLNDIGIDDIRVLRTLGVHVEVTTNNQGGGGNSQSTGKMQDVQISAIDMSNVCGTDNTSGDNTLVAAPGKHQRIVVVSFLIQNESSTATTMILKDGAGTDVWRVLGQNQGDGLSKDFPPGREWRLTVNTALVFNLSGNHQCGYSVAYFTERV